MSSMSEHEGRIITRDDMCVIERCNDGSLRTAFYPIDHDYQVLDSLRELSGTMLAWENDQRQRLVASISKLGIHLYGEKQSNIETIAGHYRDLVWNVCRLTNVGCGFKAFYPISKHDLWRHDAGIHCLPKYSEFIKGFNVSRDIIEACRARLEESAYERLEDAYRQAIDMRSVLLPALELYERAFCAYVKRARRILPEIFDRKDYCQDFSAVFGDAELDYEITPGNQYIVDGIDEYYWACVMEGLYDVYESMDDVLAYSHRKRGFFNYKIMIESKCDLHLFHETNFGFGSVRYFRSTLSYRGVSAINASFLIFFRGAGKMAFSDYTFNYEVEEESFETCFSDVVRIHAEYQTMGEAAFVDKYFRKSLSDLSDLLLIIANTDTFLQITTLERFDALTTGAKNELIPDQGFEDISFELNASETKAAEKVADMILTDVIAHGIEKCVHNTEINKLVSRLHGSRNPAELQHIVKMDLLRSLIVHRLATSLGEDYDVTALVNEIIPVASGIYVESYKGYDLIAMRAEKAMSVIVPIARLREIAALTRFESIINSIASTCMLIGNQAHDFISKEIVPELKRKMPERDQMKAQLAEMKVKLAAIEHHGGDASWVASQVESLKARLRKMDDEISVLEKQIATLQSYIQSARSIQVYR